MACAGTQRMAQLLCRTVEYAVSTEVLQVPEMDLVASTTSTFPAGPNDMGATKPVGRTTLAEIENTTRLAGKTIYRHARRCNPREEPHALARTCGSVRGARGNPGPYRDASCQASIARAIVQNGVASPKPGMSMCEMPSSLPHGSMQGVRDAVGC